MIVSTLGNCKLVEDSPSDNGNWCVELSIDGIPVMTDGEYRDWPAHKELELKAHGKVLIAGAGIFYDANLIVHKDNVERIDVVEINPSVIGLCAKRIWVPEKTRVILDDIDRYIADTEERYDVVFLDHFRECFLQANRVDYRRRCARVMVPNAQLIFWELRNAKRDGERDG